MSKKPATPNIYAKLPPPGRSPYQKLFLAETTDGIWFKFESKATCHLVADAIKQAFEGSDPFMDHYKGDRLSQLHTTLFQENIPTGQDELITALHCWNLIAATATDRTVPAKGQTTREKNLVSRKYFLTQAGLDAIKTNVYPVKTPQAVVSLKIVHDALPENKDEGCTEAVLRQAVIDRQLELKTRQNPWRIFQYYRPTLVKEGLLRHD